MAIQWFRQDKSAVLDELRRGVRPLMATTMASGPLDELVALHIEFGVFDALDRLPVDRQRAGIDDALLFRTLAALPFLPEPGLDPSARLLFQESATLLRIGCTVYAPVPKPKDPKVDRFASKPTDSPAVAAWRRRMATESAKTIYKDRAATAECVNALARGRGLVQFVVRGLEKVRAVALWYALAQNVMRAVARRAAVARGA